MKIRLQRVHYIPKVLEPGVLYVSEEFGAAAHLCPCGCGLKVRTPLGPTDWTLEETENGPTIYPSIGNWQFRCQSHYLITDGEVVLCKKWTSEQISFGYDADEKRAREYLKNLYDKRGKGLLGLWNWILRKFKP